jgi:3',5'-cyclic AMP phosphodiesterase CpdA
LRIAHISDLHLLSVEALPVHRLVGKRFTGWVNLKLRREEKHKLEVAERVARELRAHEVDHVVVTGDVTNLALQSEFELVRLFLENEVGFDPERVSLVPGNHDVYTRGSYRSRRFEHYFGAYITSDLPGATGVPGLGRFPYVRLRGPVAFVGLSTAVPRLPLIASGELGAAQRMALHSLLAHREVQKRFVVILQHHPWHNPASARHRLLEGLLDADRERDVLRVLARGLLLHGHKHRRIHRTIGTDRGHIDAIGSTSASLVDDDPHRGAGFNLYDVDDFGRLASISAFRYAPADERFVEAEVPRG